MTEILVNPFGRFGRRSGGRPLRDEETTKPALRFRPVAAVAAREVALAAPPS